MSNNTRGDGVGVRGEININNDVPPTPPRRLGSSSYAVLSKVGSMSNLSGTGGVAGALTPSSALKMHHHSSQHHRHPQPHHITSDDHAADGKHSISSRSTISRKRSDSYDSIARGGSDDDSTRSSRSFIAEILKQDSLMDVNLSAREESDYHDSDDDDEETYPPTIATTSSEDGGESTITGIITTTKTKKKKKKAKKRGKKKKKSTKDKEETVSQKDSSKLLHDQPMASISEVFSFGHHSSSGGEGGGFCSCFLSRRTICFVAGIFCSAMAGVVYPASAFILATIFQSISADPNSTNKQDFLNEIAYTTYLYVGLGFYTMIFMALSSSLLEIAANDMSYDLNVSWFKALLRQDMAYHDVSSDIAGASSMMASNCAKFRRGIGRKLGEGVIYTVAFVGGFGYAFWASWKTSIVVLAILPLMAISSSMVTKVNKQKTSFADKNYAQAGNVVYTTILAIRTVLSLNAATKMIQEFETATERAYTNAKSKGWKEGLANGFMMGSFQLSYAVLTIWGSYLVYTAVQEEHCDPSGTVDGVEACTPSGNDVFGAFLGMSMGGMGIPFISSSIELFTKARVAAYPALCAINRNVENSKKEQLELRDRENQNGKKNNKPAKVGALEQIAEEDDQDGDEEDGGAGSPNDIESGDDVIKNEKAIIGAANKTTAMVPANKTPSSTEVTKDDDGNSLPLYVIDSSSSDGVKRPIHGDIEFVNVGFTYPARKHQQILNGFNLKITAGTTVALVGPSGGGKSTIVSLIERFYDVDTGSVTIDGINIKEYNVKNLRSQIGLVQQEPILFATTIRENIKFGAARSSIEKVVSQSDIEQAAKSANAHDFITKFPDQYDTFAGDKGAQLSGGQKQRIAIARVLMQHPSILLLDEATSALDSESELIVQRSLDNLVSNKKEKRTTVIIAHRLSTIRHADQIAFVQNGTVVELGSHDELMKNPNGRYRQLVEAGSGGGGSGDGESESSTAANTDTTTTAPSTTTKKKEDPSNREEGANGSVKAGRKAGSKDTDEARDPVLPSPPSLVVTDTTTRNGDDDDDAKKITSTKNKYKTPILSFKDITFAYPTRPNNVVLKHFNLTIYQGETIALVGPSGQGKSTIVGLIERYYDPQGGSIEFLPHGSLRDINVKWLRDRIGLVEQEPTLFASSIYDNIADGLISTASTKPPTSASNDIEEQRTDKNIISERVQHAAKMANAHGFISSFPKGYDTLVGQTTQLSGGQKQRIAIARSIIKNPSIMILDEATSALDSESQNIVQDALDKLSHTSLNGASSTTTTTTTIVIAHRLSTIKKANRIAYISNGRVEEIGTFDELLSIEGGKFRRLYTLQTMNPIQFQKELLLESKKAKDDEELVVVDDTREKNETSNGNMNVTIFAANGDDSKKDDTKSEQLITKRVRQLAKGNERNLIIGGVGALLTGLIFPSWGVQFAYTIQLLYQTVDSNVDEVNDPYYYDNIVEEMKNLSWKLTYGWIGIIMITILGNILLYYGLTAASESINKQVRNMVFTSLIRQEVSYFDCLTMTPSSTATNGNGNNGGSSDGSNGTSITGKRSIGDVVTQIHDDSNLIHSFIGDPIRVLLMNISNLLVSLVIAFIFMWPFALMFLFVLPIMAFGSILESNIDNESDEEEANEVDEKAKGGDDKKKNQKKKDDEKKEDEKTSSSTSSSSSGGIALECLTYIKTIAALTMEDQKLDEYKNALKKENSIALRHHFQIGCLYGFGQGIQNWCGALLFWFGGWLLVTYPQHFTYIDLLISMSGLLFALNGVSLALQDSNTDRQQAINAAQRLFTLIDKQSLIDPLQEEEY